MHRTLSLVCLVLDHRLPYLFFNSPPTTEIYTLSLHDALPISDGRRRGLHIDGALVRRAELSVHVRVLRDRKSTRLNSSHVEISYAVFCLKKKIEVSGTCESIDYQTETQ